MLVKRYESLVAGTVIGMLGHCPEAEDVGQNTFIRFYNALDSFKGESGVGTFLTRIAINLSLNEIKRRKRNLFLFPDGAIDEIDNIAESANHVDFEMKIVVQRALQCLKPEYRAVVI